jgi:hypothetical protein
MVVRMKHEYPVRLSVDELRQELEAYLEYRRGRVEEPTIGMDRSHIGQFLGWLETGRTSRDIDELMREYMPGGESPDE